MNFLEIERLALRRFPPADVDLLVELDSDSTVMRYLRGGAPTPRSLIEQEILPRFLRSYAAHDGHGVWAAIEQATDELELGYRLRQAAWGKGCATECARALIDNGFRQLGVRRVIASTYQDNLASRRVIEKLGMTLERTFRPTLADLPAAGTVQISPDLLIEGDVVK
jgi:RimJ/RimL family protein N-acetyltransferase